MSVPAGSRPPASVLATVLTELPQGLSFVIKIHLKNFKVLGFCIVLFIPEMSVRYVCYLK